MSIALLGWCFFGRILGGQQLVGVVLGLLGLAAMAWSSSSATGFRPAGAAMSLCASATWAAGSLAASRPRLPRDPAVSLAAQLLTTAPRLALVVGTTGVGTPLRLEAVPLRAWGALAFLIVASTLVGYAVFLALNRTASPVLANSFNYVAPVIALSLSAWLPHEPLGRTRMVAACATLVGVALMVGARAE